VDIEPRIGGFRKPISTREFILEYLRKHREAFIAEMHRAYKKELVRLAIEQATIPEYKGRGRKPVLPRARKYHYSRYHSFAAQVWNLKQEGLLELSRTEATSGLHQQFKGFKELPERHYFRLARRR
jgi:hypothetical protein